MVHLHFHLPICILIILLLQFLSRASLPYLPRFLPDPCLPCILAPQNHGLLSLALRACVPEIENLYESPQIMKTLYPNFLYMIVTYTDLAMVSAVQKECVLSFQTLV